MSFLTDKFLGIYRIKAPVDLNTNDFTRKLNGSYEDIDCYIDCYNGNKIFYYGHATLEAYIPSLGRGHNILKEIDNSLVFDVVENDSEVLFKFKYSDSDAIIPLLKPKTSGAGIRPNSSKNRPKNSYTIPEEDLAKYNETVKDLKKEELINISHTTKKFIYTLCNKKRKYEDIKADMIKSGFKAKEYLHSIGKWNDYIKYLENHL